MGRVGLLWLVSGELEGPDPLENGRDPAELRRMFVNALWL